MPGCWPPAPSRSASSSRNQRAVLGHAAGGGAGRRAARRGVRPAVAAAARALSRGQHARAALRRRLSRRRVRDQARLLHRHRHRPAEIGGLAITERPRLVFHPAGRRRRRRCCSASTCCAAAPGRAWAAIRAHETVAEALGIGVAALQAAGLRHQLGDDGGRRRAVRLLPRLRLGRGLLAVPDDPVRRDDHHRRHGLAAGRAPRRRLRHAVPLRHRGRAAARCRARSATPACCSPSTMPPSAW